MITKLCLPLFNSLYNLYSDDKLSTQETKNWTDSNRTTCSEDGLKSFERVENKLSEQERNLADDESNSLSTSRYQSFFIKDSSFQSLHSIF